MDTLSLTLPSEEPRQNFFIPFTSAAVKVTGVMPALDTRWPVVVGMQLPPSAQTVTIDPG